MFHFGSSLIFFLFYYILVVIVKHFFVLGTVLFAKRTVPNTKNHSFSNLYLSPVFLFLLSTLPIIYPIVLPSPITIKSFLALVIPVYNKLRVKSIGATLGIHIITTSNSLPLCFMNCYTIAMFYLI